MAAGTGTERNIVPHSQEWRRTGARDHSSSRVRESIFLSPLESPRQRNRPIEPRQSWENGHEDAHVSPCCTVGCRRCSGFRERLRCQEFLRAAGSREPLRAPAVRYRSPGAVRRVPRPHGTPSKRRAGALTTGRRRAVAVGGCAPGSFSAFIPVVSMARGRRAPSRAAHGEYFPPSRRSSLPLAVEWLPLSAVEPSFLSG